MDRREFLKTTGAVAASVTAGAAGAVVTAEQKAAASVEQVSVRTYGVVGDGTADDTTAFGAAITACIATGKQLVVDVPILKLTTWVDVQGPIDIFFQGWLKTILASPNVALFVRGNGIRLYGLKSDGVPLVFDSTATNCELMPGAYFKNCLNAITFYQDKATPSAPTVPTNIKLWSPYFNMTLFGLNKPSMGISVDGMRDCLIQSPYFECLGGSSYAGYPIYIRGARNCSIIDPVITGRPVDAISFAVAPSVSGTLGFIDNRLIGPKIYGFKEEGISFDGLSSLWKTTVSSNTSPDLIVPANNTPTAFFAVNNFCTFQTGALRGQAYTVTYQGADGISGWTLSDGFSKVANLVQAGDVVCIEVPCRNNVIEGAFVAIGGQLTSDLPDLGPSIPIMPRPGILLWGVGRETHIRGGILQGCQLGIFALRGLPANPSGAAHQDWSVPHFVDVDGVTVYGGGKVGRYDRGDILISTWSTNRYPLANNLVGLSIRNCKAAKFQYNSDRVINPQIAFNNFKKTVTNDPGTHA